MSAPTVSSSNEVHHQRQQSFVSAPSSKPPVSLPSTAHLDPNAAIRGTHQITIGQNVVIHPRCQLYSDHGPLTIGENTLISEKCIIGGESGVKDSIKPPANPAETNTASLPQLSDETTRSTNGTHSNADFLSKGVDIGQHVHIYPAVHINYPSTISSCTVLESNVVILPNVSIGQHSKICANITIPSGSIIPDYTVVYGDDDYPQRRRRQQPQDAAEEGRLKALDREREGSMLLLRQTALKSLSSGSARKK